MIGNISNYKENICPGRYCGKINTNDSCGACPTGYLANELSLCKRCTDKLLIYDWLFLGFIIIQPIIINVYFTIRLSVKLKSNRRLWFLHLFIGIESFCSFVLSIMIFEPLGKFQLTKCTNSRLSDWYTMLYNPSPDFVNTIHCTHEAVYPLKTVILVYYFISCCITILIRPLIIIYILKDQSWLKSIYYSLYIYPLLTITYYALSGLMYYSYGYIVFISAIISSAGLFSTVLIKDISDNLSITSVLKITILKPQNLLIVGCTWFALFYGIVSITELKYPTYYGLLLASIPIPYLFFCFTLHFTNPSAEFTVMIR